MFVDASALCAILLGEAEARAFADRIEAAQKPITSAMAIYETVLAIARVNDDDVEGALRAVRALLHAADIEVVAIAEREGDAALAAHLRFGKGRHPARLNMGDCFAYACARTHDTPLLYKGEDFALTDVQPA